jgi:hypothetical protein
VARGKFGRASEFILRNNVPPSKQASSSAKKRNYRRDSRMTQFTLSHESVQWRQNRDESAPPVSRQPRGRGSLASVIPGISVCLGWALICLSSSLNTAPSSQGAPPTRALGRQARGVASCLNAKRKRRGFNIALEALSEKQGLVWPPPWRYPEEMGLVRWRSLGQVRSNRNNLQRICSP